MLFNNTNYVKCIRNLVFIVRYVKSKVERLYPCQVLIAVIGVVNFCLEQKTISDV